MSELIIPILFIIFSIIGKSIQDKKNIDKKKEERKIRKSTMANLPRTESIENDNEEPITINFEDAKIFPEEEEENKSNRYYESIFEDLEEYYGKSHDIEVEILGEEKEGNKYDLNNIQDDVFRGIIFSEILSQPKSIKNRKM